MATPLAVDQFSRWMAAKFDERKIISVPTVWQTFFGRPENSASETHYEENAKVVSIDIIRANERIAALIHRGTNSQNMGDLEPKNRAQNFSSFSRVYPLAEEESAINADQILSRLAGENPYSGRAKLDRMRELAVEYHMEHIRKFARLFEVLAGASLLTGQQPSILGTTNTDLIYDFRRNAALTITPAVPWNVAGADILGDIDGACQSLREIGHVTPNVIFLAGTEIDAFIKDTTVAGIADNLRFELIMVSSTNSVPSNLVPLETAGAIPMGSIRTPRGYKLWIFTYNDVYTNSAGNPIQYLPDGTALLGYYGARCDRYFGPPELLPIDPQRAAWYQYMFGFNMMTPPIPPMIKNEGAAVNPAMFHSSAFPTSDKAVSFKTQTAPIFATTQTDAFATLTGLHSGRES